MIAGYKVWNCHYYESSRGGYFHRIDCIVIAEIEEKALGMAIQEYPETTVRGWTAEEIPTEKEGVHWIASDGG